MSKGKIIFWILAFALLAFIFTNQVLDYMSRFKKQNQDNTIIELRTEVYLLTRDNERLSHNLRASEHFREMSRQSK